MRYMLLIYTPEDAQGAGEGGDARHGAVECVHRLAPARRASTGRATRWGPRRAATTVRVRDGQTLITDGPFAETKEALGGYYIVETDDFDLALEAAARCPGALYGSMEVRPIFDM